jgi:spore germination protein KC
LIAKGNAAADVLGLSGGIEDIPGVYLEHIIKNQSSNAKTIAVHGFQHYRNSLTEGIHPVFGIIELRKKSNTVKTKASTDDFEISLEGSALFKDFLEGFLDGIETRSYNFVRGKVKGGVLVVPIGSLIDVSSIEILSAKSDNEVELTGENIKIKTHVKIKGMLVEETAKINIKEPTMLKHIEKIASNEIKSEIEDTIKKVQKEYKSDIFGFGQLVHRKYPKVWKSLKENWDEHFSKADINVNVEVSILQTGLIGDNTRTAKEEK